LIPLRVPKDCTVNRPGDRADLPGDRADLPGDRGDLPGDSGDLPLCTSGCLDDPVASVATAVSLAGADMVEMALVARR